jgi:hypothetical protein
MEMREKPFVMGHFYQTFLLYVTEQGYGVVVVYIPAARVQPAEKILGITMPAPPHVIGQLLEGGEFGRQVRLNGKCSQRSHYFFSSRLEGFQLTADFHPTNIVPEITPVQWTTNASNAYN